MDLSNKIRSVLRENYGEFESELEIEYENMLTEKLLNGDLDDRRLWLTYNQIVLEIKHNIGDVLSTEELLYKLTEDGDIYTETCLDKASKFITESDELKRLYHKLKNL